MHILLKKLCIIGFISTFLHICSVWWIPIDLHGYDYIFGHTDSAYAAGANSAVKDEIKPDPSLTFQNRLEIYEFLVGVFLSVIGIIAITLSLLRWKS